MTQPEIRVAADTWPETELEFRAEPDGDGLTFSGYAAVFDSLSDDLGGFREIIRPGAFGESLRARRDIKMFHNHNSDIVLASKKAGTLALIEDERGLLATAKLPDSEWGRSVATAVSRGDISTMSFGFEALRTVEPKDGAARELLNVRLWEVSTVSGWPAYPATTATVRHLADLVDVAEDTMAAALKQLVADDGSLTDEQRDLLMRAIHARTSSRYVPAAVAERQARLAALIERTEIAA